MQVSVYSDNGTTYFYNPDEQLSSQLATGGVRAKEKKRETKIQKKRDFTYCDVRRV